MAPKCADRSAEATNAEVSCFKELTHHFSERSEQHRRHLPKTIRNRNLLALRHLGLAGQEASRQQRRGPEDCEDLMQEACLGVVRGAERFDPGRGLKPSTYLSNCARGQVLHYRRDRASMVRIPWRLRDLYAAGIKLQRTREQANQAPLEIEQLASSLGISSKRWIEACRCQLLTRSQAINNTASEPINAEEEDAQLLWLLEAMKRLKKADRQLLENHLVLGRSLNDLAKATRTTSRQVRHRLDRLLAQLQDWARDDGVLEITSI